MLYSTKSTYYDDFLTGENEASICLFHKLQWNDFAGAPHRGTFEVFVCLLACLAMEVKLALNSFRSSFLVQGFQAYTTMPC